MKKSVAIIISRLNGGGAERTASNLSLFLADDYDVHLIVFDGTNIKYPYRGVLHDLHTAPASGKLGKAVNFFKRVICTKRIKKENNIATSISLMDSPNMVNILSGIGDRIITSVRIQMSQSRQKNGKLDKKSFMRMQWIGKKSDLVVALSKGVEEDLIQTYGVDSDKVLTIYNPCDGEMLLEKGSINDKLAETIKREKAITVMGRMTDQKGQWHIIKAMSRILESIPDAKLYVLGEGPHFDKLKKLVTDLNIEKSVVFLGFIEAPHKIINASKVFVFPSLYEGLGNVLIEALSCGTPSVAADCYSGPREILAPNTKVEEILANYALCEYGILTSVGKNIDFDAKTELSHDEEQLAEAVIAILSDPELWKKYHEKALERAAQFKPEEIKRQWIEII